MWSRTFAVLIFLTMGMSNAWALPNCDDSKDASTWSNCVGILLEPIGDKYVGEYKDGKQHGQGTYTWVSGDKYVGEYKDGKQHGQGTYTYVNGGKYVGDWKDGKEHGQGTFTYANGNKYVGEFLNGKFNGKGTLTYPDGEQQTGEFKNNEPIGSQKFIDKRGLPLSEYAIKNLFRLND